MMYSSRFRSRFVILIVLATFVTQLIQPVTFNSSVSAQADPLSIGALIGLIEFVSDKINSIIETASDEARVVLKDLNTSLSALKDSLKKDIQSTTNVVVTSVDNTSRTKLYEVQMLLYTISDILGQGADKIEGSALNVLHEASITVAQSVNQVTNAFGNSVVIVTEAGAFLIDRTTNNIITIGSLFLLLIGLLIIIVLLFVKKLRSGFQLIMLLIVMMLFVGIGVISSFFPSIRMKALGNAGVATHLESLVNQPALFGYRPNPVILDEQNHELMLVGANLRPNGVDPTVNVGGTNANLSAVGDDAIAVDITGFAAPAHPSVSVQLQYPDITRQPAIVVQMVTPTPVPQPPDLALIGMTVSASSAEINQEITAFITVQNAGGSGSSNSLVRINIGSSVTPDARPVPSLAVGETTTIQIPFHYTDPGTYTISVSVDMSAKELNGSNNAAANHLLVTVLNPSVEQEYASGIFSRVNWPGSKGTDTINGGASSGSDCLVKKVYVDVFETERDSSRILSTIEPGQTANLGSVWTWGTYFVESYVDTNNYRAVLNWWQDFNTVLHYRIRYVTEGRNCQAPPFTMETVRR